MDWKILHLSDLHAGWRFDLDVAERLAVQAHEMKPDLVVISGDFVLRADLTMQWRTIAAYLRMLPQPQMLVPGNHDIPLFNEFSRIFFPFRHYLRYMTATLNPVFYGPGLAVVGGSSAHGWTIDGGYLYRDQVRKIVQAFDGAAADACRVLVLHHHVVDPPGHVRRRKIRNARTVVELMEQQRVDLFLCGHTHMSYVAPLQTLWPGLRYPVIVSQCGTSTSRRGRGHEQGKNSFHCIHINEDMIHITPYHYHAGVGSFLPTAVYQFHRYAPMAATDQANSSRSG